MTFEYRGHKITLDDAGVNLFLSYTWQVLKLNSGPRLARKQTLTPGRSGKSTTILFHRELLSCPDDKIVDHINHDSLDNRLCNLRICTKSQNGMNKKKSWNKTSRFKGVYWNKKYNKWSVYVIADKKKHFFGYFDDEEFARTVYIENAKRLHGDFFYEG